MSGNRLLTSIAVMAATIMQVLDTTITNIALPNMAGELDATPDNISWVLTSYLIASAMVMPLTGYFTDRIGQKRFLLASVAGFVITSALCGMANSLFEIVLFRFMQGLFGAPLVPMSQAIMLQVFPGEQRGKAMAIWAMGVMVAPILGPTLGGWLTEEMSWRWTFYINLPVGVISFFLAWRHVNDSAIKARRMDWVGFTTLAIGIGALQLVLDRGNQDDWFSSQALTIAAFLSAAAFVVFVVYTLTGKHHPLFDLRIFRDRNYLFATLVIILTSVGFFGGMLLQSLFLQNYLGYPTFEAGLYMAPRGVASFIVMMFVGKLSGKVAPRNFIIVGIFASVAGNYMMTLLSGDIAAHDLIIPAMLQGAGMGLIFVPISTLAFTTLPKEAAAEAAGIYSLIRAMGSALGISILATYFSRDAQQNWNLLRGAVTQYSEPLRHYLAPLHLRAQDAQGVALAAKEVLHQAHGIAYMDSFWFATLNFVAMLPLLLLLRSGKPAPVQATPE